MRKASYIAIADPDTSKQVESDAFTCGHCNRIVPVPPYTDPASIGGRCGVCDSLICPECVAKGTCDPLEEKLARAEASYHARRSYGF